MNNKISNKMTRQLIYFITFITLTLSFSGCKKPPEWDKTPHIEFTEISKKHYIKDACSCSSCDCDSIFITIYFRDGDGDIGLSDADSVILPKINFYVTLLIYKDSVFKPFELCDCSVTLSQPFDGHSPPLYPEGYSGPLDGFIDYSISFQTTDLLDPCCKFPPETLDSAVIKFTLQLVDRALNKSNIVETSPITISK
ncbi:MAG: hypothetical protein IIA88_01685 [Bacteroidetes bacterium]|nr:hypothetical protein [Bacteroidota bacterium]